MLLLLLVNKQGGLKRSQLAPGGRSTSPYYVVLLLKGSPHALKAQFFNIVQGEGGRGGEPMFNNFVAKFEYSIVNCFLAT